MADGISIREFARRKGVQHHAVQKRIAHGTLSTLPNGKLDPETAAREWTENRDESKVRKPDGVATPKPPVPPRSGSAGSGQTPERTFADAKTKREYVRLEKEALQLKQFKGELVPLAEINAHVAGMIIRARELLIRIGPELQDRLAQETDGRKCCEMVAGEVRRALHELSEFKAA